jgi:N-carbamoyl-L-amino-acid hydrolase
MTGAGFDPVGVGVDRRALARVGCFVELHVEQGRGLVDLGRPVAIGSGIWPHGRWRIDIAGEANHAGTTRLSDRRDPTLEHAALVLAARALAEQHDAVATVGKVVVRPNGVNAIPSSVTAWLDARGPHSDSVRSLVADLSALAAADTTVTRESWTDATSFDHGLLGTARRVLPDAPLLATGAGHDAGILANAGIPALMLFVRNPTGVSHSPAEYAEPADCHAGVAALTDLVRVLAA